jgi:hypothetical protein
MDRINVVSRSKPFATCLGPIEVVGKKDASKGISKEEAIEIARQVCKKEGWPDTYNIWVVEDEDKWEVQTSFNGIIRIDKKTGAVLEEFIHRFGGVAPPE